MTEKTILKVTYPLSNTGLFLEVENPAITLDSAIQSAVENLHSEGKNLEASQLESLYRTHQIHVDGRLVGKGTLISELPANIQSVNGLTINYQEAVLLAEHVGGFN